MNASSLAVAFLDYNASFFLRVWCCFELHVLLQRGMELEFYTSAGCVGKEAASLPLLETLQHFDIRKCEASEPSYRRKIFNYIAGVDEYSGLKVDGAGKPFQRTRRPSLLDTEEDEISLLAPPRSNGKPEYGREACRIAPPLTSPNGWQIFIRR